MPDLEARAILLGFALGLLASGVFFGGLAWSVRQALRARHPMPLLAVSFAMRAALLVGTAWWLVRTTNPVLALPAYLLAFFLVRGAAVRLAHRGAGSKPALPGER